MAVPARRLWSFAEYIAWEQSQVDKHEYYDGEAIAMAGGTPLHSWVATRLAGLLMVALRGRPCAPYNTDLRVRVPATGLATYPDLSVICGPLARDPEDRNTATNPTVLVEVLSPSTERYDRGEKFEHYQQIPSLQDYVLVSTAPPKVEVFHRNTDGSWRYTRAGPGETVIIASVDVRLSVDEIYEGAPEEELEPAAPSVG